MKLQLETVTPGPNKSLTKWKDGAWWSYCRTCRRWTTENKHHKTGQHVCSDSPTQSEPNGHNARPPPPPQLAQPPHQSGPGTLYNLPNSCLSLNLVLSLLEPNHIGDIFIYWLGYNIQGMRLGIHVRGDGNTLHILFYCLYLVWSNCGLQY